MLYFIGQVFPYIAVAVFILGMGWRIASWIRTPVPFQLTIFPAPFTTSGRIVAVGKELLFFSSLRRGDFSLWLWAWILHITLALIIIGHIVGIYYLGHQFTMVGLSEADSSKLSALFGTAAGVGFFAGLVVLFYRRTAVPEVKRLSDPADYFDLLLLMAIVVSGMHMRLTSIEIDLPAIRQYMGSLILLHPMPIPHDWIFVSHFTLVNILLLYFPFSKLVHFAGFLVNRAMLVEGVPQYPTPTGVSRDVQVLRGGVSQ